MKLNRCLMTATVAAVMWSGTAIGLAQQDNQGPGPGPGGAGGGRGPMDPAQFRQRMMDNVKTQLEIKDDTDWKAIQPLVQKVMDARMATMSGMGRGMFGRPRGGDNKPGGDQGQQRRGFMGQASSAEADALQKAIDSNAPKADLKLALDKFVASRKAKQAALEQAQEDLRKVLTSRQEAIAALNGWL